MSNRKLTVLCVIAVIMILWVVAQWRISSGPKPLKPAGPTYLIQGLEPADTGKIIVGEGNDIVTLIRTEGHFVVTNKDNYPATAKAINDLITSCLDIKTTELYTSDPANHKDLGVTEDKARYVVKFLRPDSSLISGVLVGNSKEQGQGSYVRLADRDDVYTTEESPWIRTRAIDYVNQEICSLKQEDIEWSTVSSAEEQYTFKKQDPNSEEIILENLPEGKKLKDYDYKQVFGALTSLRFDDVQKKSDKNKDLKFDRKFTCRIKDSTLYTINIAQKDQKNFVACTAEFTDTTPVTKEKEVESEEELKKKEAKLLARDKATEFAAKHGNWIYEIPDYKAKYLTKKLSDLLEDKEKPKQQGTVPDPNSPSEPNSAGDKP